MNCTQIQQLLPEWLDGELDAATAGQIEKHVATCDVCSAEADIWRNIGSVLREGMPDIKTPPGLVASVMSQLPEQRSTFAAGLFTRWKRSIAVAAAFMLVTLGSAGAYLNWGGNMAGQLAGNGKGNLSNFEQNVPTTSPPENETNKQTEPDDQPGDVQADPGQTQQTGGNDSNNNTNDTDANANKDTTQQGDTKDGQADPNAGSGTVKPPAKDAGQQQYVLLGTDKNRVLDRIFLNVKVDDLQAAHRQALALINSSNATYEVLASEYTPAGNQESLKIIVDDGSSYDLLDNLKKLGQVLNNDAQPVDINARYKEKVEQYQELASQLGSSGPAEQEELKVKLATIEAQLKAWDQEADTDTIILWLGN